MWEFLTNLEENLATVAEQLGPWAYVLIASIITAETAIFASPFLPGDSLIFASGVLAARGVLNPHLLVVLLCIATLVGDSANYAIGRFAGAQLLARRKIRRADVRRASRFFKQYGWLTLAITRFIPILRMIAPFTAGLSRITFFRFVLMNTLGVVLWVPSGIYGSYLLGQFPWVRENFMLIIIGFGAAMLLALAAKLLYAHRTLRPVR